MQLPPEVTAVGPFIGTEPTGTPDEFALEFRWFRRSTIHQLDIHPWPWREPCAAHFQTGRHG